MRYLLIISLFLSLASCTNGEKPNYEPLTYLTQSEVDDFKYKIIRHVGKLAGKADHTTKFNEEFDTHYRKLAANHDLLYFYEDKKSGEVYFLVTRVAPSIHYKKVATGGMIKRNESGEILYYEEAFRTWKMEVEELEEKSLILFTDYVNKKDLNKYYAVNSGGEEYIEFPNEDVYFDTEKRIWISNITHPMAAYYDAAPGS